MRLVGPDPIESSIKGNGDLRKWACKYLRGLPHCTGHWVATLGCGCAYKPRMLVFSEKGEISSPGLQTVNIWVRRGTNLV